METRTITEVAIDEYGEEREEMYEYVQDASERGYPIEVSRFERGSCIGIEVMLDDDRLAHFGTLQDIARGAVDDWFLRDLEPVGNSQVRIEFVIDTEIDLSRWNK